MLLNNNKPSKLLGTRANAAKQCTYLLMNIYIQSKAAKCIMVGRSNKHHNKRHKASQHSKHKLYQYKTIQSII